MNSSNTGGTLGPLVSTGISLAAGFDGREDLEERASKEGIDLMSRRGCIFEEKTSFQEKSEKVVL